MERSSEARIASLKMHETDLTTIDAQITAGLAIEGSIEGFLNSFASKLTASGTSRMMIETIDGLDEMCAEAPNELHSQLYFDTTCREFFADIDLAVEAAELIEPEERARLSETYFAVTSDEVNSQTINTLLVYRNLRVMGYSHYDLWQ